LVFGRWKPTRIEVDQEVWCLGNPASSKIRPIRDYRESLALTSRAILKAVDESETRPGFVDGTNLIVNQAGR
jgi:hypothetical protein